LVLLSAVFHARHQQLREHILPLLPSLHELELVHALYTIDPVLPCAIATFFSLPVDFGCETRRYVTVQAPLFSHRLESPSLEMPDVFYSYADAQVTFSHNCITFRGTSDSGPHAWAGVALEVHEEPDPEADERYVKEVNEAYKDPLDPQRLL